MQVLINTIMLEENRWGADKTPDPDLTALLPMIADRTGYRNVEVWQYHVSGKSLDQAREVKEIAERHGLSLAIVGAYPKINLVGAERVEESRLLKHVIDCAHLFGGEIVKFFASGSNSQDATEDDWRAAVEFLREHLDYADERGITMAAEAHGNTFGDTVDGMKRLLADTDRPNLKVCYQPYGFASTEQAIADFDALREDVVHLHLQNRSGKEMSLLSDGDMDYQEYLRHVRESGFDGWLGVEFTKDIHQEGTFDIGRVLDNAELDRQFILEVWGAAGPA